MIISLLPTSSPSRSDASRTGPGLPEYQPVNHAVPTIYVVTTEPPSLRSGAPVRNYHLLKGLVNAGYRVRLFTILKAEHITDVGDLKRDVDITIDVAIQQPLSIVQQAAVALIDGTIPYLREFEQSGIARLLLCAMEQEQPAMVYVEHFNALYAIRSVLRACKQRGIALVYDAHNVEQTSMRQTVYAFPIMKRLVGMSILPHFVHTENRLLRGADHVFACSAVDAAALQRLAPGAPVTVVPNGVDSTRYTPAPHAEPDTLCFMGALDYWPNEDGIRYYFQHIHHHLQTYRSGLRVYIVGRRPPAWLVTQAQRDPTIIVTGFVEDVRPYLERAAICICPLRIGSGTRLKILEYMAMGKPIVSTHIGVEGLNVQDGKHVLLADAPEQFAAAVRTLLDTPSFASTVGDNARQLVVQSYDWGQITRHMLGTVESLISRPRSESYQKPE